MAEHPSPDPSVDISDAQVLRALDDARKTLNALYRLATEENYPEVLDAFFCLGEDMEMYAEKISIRMEDDEEVR
jgi:hypothetical protein